jgi:hypothetical protein
MQEGSHAEAAGQDVEHEVARMATPLMFAFNNDDSDGNISSKKMKMRIGWLEININAFIKNWHLDYLIFL